MRALIRIVAALAVSSLASVANSEDFSTGSLRGLVGVGVDVTIQDTSHLFAEYVDKDALQTTVELRLRQNGIRVLSREQMLADRRIPSLEIVVQGMPDDKDSGEATSFAILITLGLNQIATVATGKTSVVMVLVDTWSRRMLGVYGTTTLRGGVLTKNVGDMTDAFVNDWLATHGK